MRRRDFLKHAAVAAATLSASLRKDLAFNQKRLERRGAAKKVVILGAGLAGLSAAYELDQAGHDVTVLEARLRPGGRVLTLREPFSDGLYNEAGAAYIPGTHDLTIHYVKLFGLALDPMVSSPLATVFNIRGHRVVARSTETAVWPVTLADDGPHRGIADLNRRYVEPAVQQLRRGSDENLRQWDAISFADFLRRQGASAGAIELLRLGYFDLLGEGVESYSALYLLRTLASEGEGEFAIRGGFDLLPKAFATRLKDRIRYGAPVIRIEQDTKGVKATYLQAGRYQSINSDRLICTLPFSVLKSVQVSPNFSPRRRAFIEELPYVSYSRIFLQVRTRIWLEEGLSGAAVLDSPRASIVDGTASQPPGGRGILRMTVGGSEARRVAGMAEQDRLHFAVGVLDRINSRIRESVEGGVSKCWDDDEWSQGAYAWFRPGQIGSLGTEISKPEGRVHFAGDHTSTLPGWMQGALNSGLRAAKEVNEALD